MNYCDCCEWSGGDDALACDLYSIPDLLDRIEPGGVVPSGECPECGALCYPSPPTTNPNR